MASASPSSRPHWQRNGVFRFFASLKLAVVLLAVLIIGAIAGTLYESTFDAKVARAYVYGAPWFNLWLLLLAANLTGSALSRWPWRKHHVAFLITHLGIITLLAGSLIGRTWGVEGTITLFKGEPATNRLLIDQHQLRVRDTDSLVKGYPVEFIHRPPTRERPRELGRLAGGERLSIVEYAPAIEGKLNPKAVREGGAPALHFRMATALMGQQLESWLLADDKQHGTFAMGLANIELKRGKAPEGAASTPANEAKTTGEVEIEEAIFAFAKAPEEQIGRVIKGGNSGAKVKLEQEGTKGRVHISLGGKEAAFDVAENLGREVKIEETPFALKIDSYWPDFRIEDGKPGTLSEQPNNPAVLVTVRGRGVPLSAAPSAHGGEKTLSTNGGPPTMPRPGEETLNHLTLFVAEDGGISYDLVSRKGGHSTGKLEVNEPLTTGWADWQLTVDRTMPQAEEWMDFNPATAAGTVELPDGVRVRLQQGTQSTEQWVPAGWQVSMPARAGDLHVAYGWQQVPLPVGLELLEFEVQRNEGSDSPAGFKSTVRVTDQEGQSATGQCWMNNPFSFPGGWWRAWTGLTFKMSQASWNPDNLGQSTIQILRDPGWLLKWVGSLLIVTGIFLLFYVKGFRRPAKPVRARAATEQEKALVTSATVLLMAALMSSCVHRAKTARPEAARAGTPWGYYSGAIDTRWSEDGRTMTLLNELRYTDPRGVVWIAPAGSVIDGASIPRALWSIMGGPFEGKYRNASVLHDVAYDQHTHPPAETDRMFYEAMRCSGVSALEAKTMYYSLLRFGRHWNFAIKRAKPIAPGSSESLAEETAPRATALEPGEVDAIHQWIRQNDPTLEQLKTQAAARRHWWQWRR